MYNSAGCTKVDHCKREAAYAKCGADKTVH